MDGERTETVTCSGIPVRKGRSLPHWLVVGICIIFFVVGNSAGMLSSWFYFQRTGNTQLLRFLLPNPHKKTFVTARYLLSCGVLGVMTAVISLLYSLGWFSMPCSFSFYLISTSRKPGVVSRGHYLVGIVSTVLAFAIHGLLPPLSQRAFQFAGGEENVSIIFISQGFSFIVAAMVGMVGVFMSRDFEHWPIGSLGYLITVICSVVAWQTLFFAILGLVSWHLLYFQM